MDITHFNPTTDPGTSFTEYLRIAQPELLPNFMAHHVDSLDPEQHVHATTVVAMRFADGVIMAGDRRATIGHTIAYRKMDKVIPADSHSGIAISGSADLAMNIVKLFQVELEHYEKMAGMQLSFEGKANLLSQFVRGNFSMLAQGFAVIPLFAGYDLAHKTGRVLTYGGLGGRYEEYEFVATGSGSVQARNWIKASYKSDLSEVDAIDIAIRSLFAAADEDAATGGPDLVRKIFPTIAVITDEGYRAMDDVLVEARAISLLAGPEQGGDQ